MATSMSGSSGAQLGQDEDHASEERRKAAQRSHRGRERVAESSALKQSAFEDNQGRVRVAESSSEPVAVSLRGQPRTSGANDDAKTKQATANEERRVRGILGWLVVISFLRFARSIQWYLGREVATNLRIIVATQFHFIFYASRPLPNIFALVLVLYSVSLWLEDDLKGSARWAIAATILFRFELVLLFGPLFLPSLLRGRIPLFSPFNQSAVWIALSTVIPLVVLFLPIDSFFWRRPCWPELDVIRFNVLDNRSHEYGTSPALWYFTSALPRSLLASAIFIPISLIFDHRRILPLIAPFIAFVGLYSILPHKELRFIIYVIPVLSVPAAVVFARLYLNRHKSIVYRMMSWGFYVLVATNLVANVVFTLASVSNYAGGDALSWLQHSQRYDRARVKSVHIDVYAAQTGVSRFYQAYDAWEYNKTEGLSLEELNRFDFLIVGSDSEPLKALIERDYPSHRPMVMLRGFGSMKYRMPKSASDLLQPLHFIPSIELKERVVVLTKRDPDEKKKEEPKGLKRGFM